MGIISVFNSLFDDKEMKGTCIYLKSLSVGGHLSWRLETIFQNVGGPTKICDEPWQHEEDALF